MITTAYTLPEPLALNLKGSPLFPRNWPFALDCVPKTAHLVGGIVRDALLNRQPAYLDLDFVVPEGSVEIAQAIARQYRAGFVVLDAERQIARVVFDNATVDFALQEGDSLEQDLRRRDFTINAIAYSPHRQALVDPMHGYEDILRRQVRMISRHNLEDDPLRLLRAYRQAAQLGFELEWQTEQAIGELSDRISRVAAERVQSELSTLLSQALVQTQGQSQEQSQPQSQPQSHATAWLRRAWQAGLLRAWLPAIGATHLNQVASLDGLAGWLGDGGAGLLQPPPSFSKSSLGKEGCLPVAKLVSLTDADPVVAESQVQGLKYSRLEMRAAGTVRRLQPQLRSPALSIREQYFLFQAAGDLFPVLALVELAQQLENPNVSLSSEKLELSEVPGKLLLSLIERYLDPADPVVHPHPLLSGKLLMQALGIKPGPQIGVLLTALQIAQAEGQVNSEAEAIAWLKANQALLLG